MRWPWSARLEAREREAQARAEQALAELQRVKAQWPEVRANVAASEREAEMNGYTRTAQILFEGRS